MSTPRLPLIRPEQEMNQVLDQAELVRRVTEVLATGSGHRQLAGGEPLYDSTVEASTDAGVCCIGQAPGSVVLLDSRRGRLLDVLCAAAAEEKGEAALVLIVEGG